MSRYADVRAGFPKPAAQPREGREHLDQFKAMLRSPHPIQTLVKERSEELYRELGGDDIDLAIDGLRATLRIGKRELERADREAEAEAALPKEPAQDGPDKPKPAPKRRPLVTGAQLIRATAELRRWVDKRDHMRAAAMDLVTKDLGLLETRLNARRDEQPFAMTEDEVATYAQAMSAEHAHAPPA